MPAATAQPKRILRHTTQTPAQRAFWQSAARFRLLVGGVGSGKTRAGCVEVLCQPAGSVGMVVAPTYPMLRDATLRTFLELAQKGGVLADYSKSEFTATLINGTRVLFRSADDPDRLRGPNLGWFYLDEAALMSREAWLIMIGRLRLAPGRAWATSTPRGINWLYDVFHSGDPDYAVIRSSTRENPYLPAGFVESLENAYTTAWQRQEIEGEFVEMADAVFHARDLDAAEAGAAGQQPAQPGRAYLTSVDIGRRQDATVINVFDTSQEPYQRVYHERLERVPYPAIQQTIEAVYAQYGGRVWIESNGVGDPVIENLDIPTRALTPFVTTSRTKTQAIQALQLLLQQGRLKARWSPQERRELTMYQWSDEKLQQDCVMSLAIGAYAIEQPPPPRRTIIGAS